MSNLSEFWKQSEGDDWFKRNKQVISDFTLKDEIIISNISKYNIEKHNILEIGCCDGSRLNQMSKTFRETKLYGIDISKEAIEHGKKLYPDITFFKPNGIEELQKIEPNFFDIIIFGHCFMVFDIEKYQEIIFKVSRILKDNGHIIISDFYSKTGKINIPWKHNLSYHCNKFDYSKLFTAFPNYILINRTFINHESNVDNTKKYEFNNIDEVVTIDIIRKFKNVDINI